MANHIQKLTSCLKEAERVILVASDVARYTFTYPWQDIRFGIKMTKAEPERYLDRWIGVRQAEYSFIGLVVGAIREVVSVMGTNRLIESGLLARAPWSRPSWLRCSSYRNSLLHRGLRRQLSTYP